MFIEIVPNRNSPPAVLLRESYRQDGKVKKRTLGNLSKLPMPVIEGLRTLLKGGVAFAEAGEALEIRRALPHGHVAAVLGVLRDLGLDRLLAGGRLDPAEARLRDLALALIVARVIEPGSKLSTLRRLSLETASSSLGLVLGLAGDGAPAIEIREIYAALDWLGAQQDRIERRPGASAARCGARSRSASPSAPSSTATRWPSTSSSRSPRTASATAAAARRSTPKPGSTAST